MSTSRVGTDDGQRLTSRLLELLGMPCVTGQEGPIADRLEHRYVGREQVARVGHSLVVGTPATDRANVLLVGHLDVVPPTEVDLEPRVSDGCVFGRGASDMKAGVAVAMDCFEDFHLRDGPYNLMLVAYAGEEGPHEANELAAVLAEVPAVGDAQLAVVLEPTDLEVQLGCMGTLHAELTFSGRAAHSARPWYGENALTGAGEFLAALHRRRPVDVDVDGLTFREVVTATQAATHNARNVVPDTFVVNLNYRFAPDKTPAQAERTVRALVGERAAVAVTDRAPAAPPRRNDTLVSAFVAASGAAVQPKQAWTDVARFAEAGVPALNYGPGLTAQAHRSGEYVPVDNLVRARAILTRFLSGATRGSSSSSAVR